MVWPIYITPLAGHDRDRSALGQGRDAAGDSALLSDTVLLTLYVDRGPVIEPSFRVTILQRGGGGGFHSKWSVSTRHGTTPAQRARQGLWRGGKLRASAKERGSEAWAHAPSDCEQAGGGGSQIGDRARAPPVCIRVAPVCIPATARMGTPCMRSSSARRRRHIGGGATWPSHTGGSHMGARRYAYGWPRYAYRGVRHTGDNRSPA